MAFTPLSRSFKHTALCRRAATIFMAALIFALTGCKGSQSDEPSASGVQPSPTHDPTPAPTAPPRPSDPTPAPGAPPVPSDPTPAPGDPLPPPVPPQPPTTGLTVSWLAPTENTDGSALADLSGFIIYYGSRSDALTNSIEIPTVGMLTYVVDGLVPAQTYYFAVTATNSRGFESERSNVAQAQTH